MKSIYEVIAGSPNTPTVSSYQQGTNSITLTDGNVVPPAPNLVTLYYNNEFVTLLYTSKNVNALGGLSYVEGNSGVMFPAGSIASRVWTKYDHDGFNEHISNMENPMTGSLQLTVVPQATSVAKSGVKDTQGNYPVYTYTRANGTKYMVSTLSGGVPPLWAVRTVQYFSETNQVTPYLTVVYDLVYDGDDEVVSETIRGS